MKAIIFDFDGTILDTESSWLEVFKQIAEEYGTTLPMHVWEQCVGTDDNPYYEFLEKESGIKINRKEILRKKREIHIKHMENQPLCDGVYEYIVAAKEKGFKLAIASSSRNEWVLKHLRKFELDSFFDVVMTSDKVSNIKPDPELYIKALEALGVSADEAVAFEDSPNGTRAAKAAGIKTIIVPNPVTETLVFDEYDMRISSMSDLLLDELLAAILEK